MDVNNGNAPDTTKRSFVRNNSSPQMGPSSIPVTRSASLETAIPPLLLNAKSELNSSDNNENAPDTSKRGVVRNNSLPEMRTRGNSTISSEENSSKTPRTWVEKTMTMEEL